MILTTTLATALSGTALGGALSWLGGSTILAGLTRFGLGLAAQYALGALIRPKPNAQSVKLETSYGVARPREVILGICGTAGHLVYRNAAGDGNRHIQDIYRLSDWRIAGINRVRFKGEWQGFTGAEDPNLGRRIENTEAVIYNKVFHGGMDQLASAHAVSSSGGRWTVAHRGVGIGYAYVPYVLDREHLSRPWEAFFEVQGPNLYDWRSDDTAGGDGDDRWDDPDTWSGYPDNPVLQMYALERGLFNGTERIIGKGVSAARLPLAQWTLAANVCDEIVEGKRRYRSSIIAAAGEGVTHDTNMKALLEATAATWVEDASGEYPIVGAVQTPLATFTDDDLMPGEPFRVSLKRPRSELVNTVAGTWRDPEKFYEAVAFTPRIDTDAIIEDRERLASSIPFGAVNGSDCVDRLADIMIRASRHQANASLCLHPKFLDVVKPGRWLTWNSAEYGNMTFQVISKKLGPIGKSGTRNIHVDLKQVSAGVFDPTEYVTVPTVSLPPNTPIYATVATNFLAQGVGVSAENNEVIPGLRFTWDDFTDVTVIGLDIEYRPLGQTDSIIKRIDSSQNIFITVEGILSDTDYEYRHRLVTSPFRTTFFTDWGLVHSPTAALPPISVELGNLQQSLRDLLARLNEQYEDVMLRLETVAGAAMNASGRTSTELSAGRRFRNATAASLLQLTAEITETNGELEAVSEAVLAIQSTVGDVGAGAVWRMVAVAGTGDTYVKVVLQLKANSGGTWVSVGTVWEAGITGGIPFGQITQIADKFVVTDGTDTGYPLVFEDGQLKLQVARIGTAIVEQLQSANGKLTINGGGSDSDISIIV